MTPTPLPLGLVTTPAVPTLEAIAKSIIAGQPPTWGDRDWTVSIKKSVAKLGIATGWRICTSSVEDIERDSEWLFDQTWYHNNEHGTLAEIGLVLESEWGDFSAIRYDFEKLLIARAPVKVMVFCDEKLRCEQAFDDLALGIRLYRHGDRKERYLLACWRGGPRGFDFCKLMGDGTRIGDVAINVTPG